MPEILRMNLLPTMISMEKQNNFAYEDTYETSHLIADAGSPFPRAKELHGETEHVVGTYEDWVKLWIEADRIWESKSWSRLEFTDNLTNEILRHIKNSNRTKLSACYFW